MSTTKFNEWLSEVKDFSLTQLIQAQKTILAEVKHKATTLQTVGSGKSNGSGNTEADTLDASASLTIAGQVARLIRDDLSPELAGEVMGLTGLNDKALWKAARSRIRAASLKELNRFNYKQQKYGAASLSESEHFSQQELLDEHGRYLVIRAYAALILKERGYDIASLGPRQ